MADDPYVKLFREILSEKWEVKSVTRLPSDDVPGTVKIRACLRNDHGLTWYFEQRFGQDFLDAVPGDPNLHAFIHHEVLNLHTSLDARTSPPPVADETAPARPARSALRESTGDE